MFSNQNFPGFTAAHDTWQLWTWYSLGNQCFGIYHRHLCRTMAKMGENTRMEEVVFGNPHPRPKSFMCLVPYHTELDHVITQLFPCHDVIISSNLSWMSPLPIYPVAILSTLKWMLLKLWFVFCGSKVIVLPYSDRFINHSLKPPLLIQQYIYLMKSKQFPLSRSNHGVEWEN